MVERSHVVASLRCAAAVTAALMLNCYFFNVSSLAPTVVAHVMSGHVGASFDSSMTRVLGVVIGMACAFAFVAVGKCEPLALGAGVAATSLLFGYVRVGGGKAGMSSYGGVVMALTSLTVLLGHCAKGRREQFLSAQQLMLASFCMLADEAL